MACQEIFVLNSTFYFLDEIFLFSLFTDIEVNPLHKKYTWMNTLYVENTILYVIYVGYEIYAMGIFFCHQQL